MGGGGGLKKGKVGERNGRESLNKKSREGSQKEDT